MQAARVTTHGAGGFPIPTPDADYMKKGDVIVIAGVNAMVASYPANPLAQRLVAAQERGVKLAAVDPRMSETAIVCRGDKENSVPGWVGIKPGGGGLVSLGMLKALAEGSVPGAAYDELSPSRKGGPDRGYGCNPQGFGNEEGADTLFVSALSGDYKKGATTFTVNIKGSGASTMDKVKRLVGAQVGLDFGVEGKQEIVDVIAVKAEGDKAVITIAQPAMYAHANGAAITEDLNLKDYVKGLDWGLVVKESGASKEVITGMARMFFGAAKEGKKAVWESKRGDAMLTNGAQAIRSGLILNAFVPANFDKRTFGVEGGWANYFGASVKDRPVVAKHSFEGGDYYYFRLWLLEDAPAGTTTFKVGSGPAKKMAKLLKRPVEFYRKVALRSSPGISELSADQKLATDALIAGAILAKAGSIIKAGSDIGANSVVKDAASCPAMGGDWADGMLKTKKKLTADATLMMDVMLEDGSLIKEGSVLKTGSNIWDAGNRDQIGGTYRHGDGGTVESAVPVAVDVNAGTVTLDFGGGKGSSYFHKATTTIKWEVPYLKHALLHHSYPWAEEQNTHHIFANLGRVFPYGVIMQQFTGYTLSFPDNSAVTPVLKDTKKIPYHIAMDTYLGDYSAHADIILPVETYLERWEYVPAFWVSYVKKVNLRQPVLFDISQARAGKSTNGALFEAKDLREIYYDIINIINHDGTYTGPVMKEGKPAGINWGYSWGTRTYKIDDKGSLIGVSDAGKAGPIDSNGARYGAKDSGGNGAADPYGVLFWHKMRIRAMGATPADAVSGYKGSGAGAVDPDIGQLMMEANNMSFVDATTDEKRLDYLMANGVLYKTDTNNVAADQTLASALTASGGIDILPGSMLAAGTILKTGTLIPYPADQKAIGGSISGNRLTSDHTIASDATLTGNIISAPGSVLGGKTKLKGGSSVWSAQDRSALGGKYAGVNKFSMGPVNLDGAVGNYKEKSDIPGVPGNRTKAKANLKVQAFAVTLAGVPSPGEGKEGLSAESGNTAYHGLPEWTPLDTSLARPEDDLSLITFKAATFTKTRLSNQPILKEIIWENEVVINPEDAGKRGIKNGDKVVVEARQRTTGTNDYRIEKVEGPARVTKGIKTGVVGICGIFGHKYFGKYTVDNRANRLDSAGTKWPEQKLPDNPDAKYKGEYVWSRPDGHQNTGMNTGKVIWSLTEPISGAAQYHGTKVRVYKKA